jgi:hypothetical protein
VTGFNQTAISSYHYSGWAATAYATDPDTREQGTTDLSSLVKDYELRWTGEFEPETVNGQVLMHVKEGTGSMARIFNARGDDLENHPMNPNPGVDEPFMVRIPFEVWNVDDNIQVNFDMTDRLQTFSTNDTVWAFNPYGRMYCEIVNTPYKEELYTDDDLNEMTWNLVFWDAPYQKGDVIKIIYANPIIHGVDEFTFSTDGLGETFSEDEAKEDVGNVNVFPNPYYAYNALEADRFNRFVTFTHLPPKAEIRIFNLAGVQVRYLEKDDATQFMQWDLQNESQLPVGSGLYIAHIDMPDLGKTKVLKVMIVQPKQILEYY